MLVAYAMYVFLQAKIYLNNLRVCFKWIAQCQPNIYHFSTLQQKKSGENERSQEAGHWRSQLHQVCLLELVNLVWLVLKWGEHRIDWKKFKLRIVQQCVCMLELALRPYRQRNPDLPSWIEDLEDTLECPVCLRIFLDPPVYYCENQHPLCSKCHQPLFKESKPCPICRGQVCSWGTKLFEYF